MITSFLDTISDNAARFITKKRIAVHDQSGNANNRYNLSKQLRFKTSMLRSNLLGFSDAYIVVNGFIIFTNPDDNAYDK